MSQCGIEWSDGWSPEHICRKLSGHPGDHQCQCDAFTSQWMIDNGDDALYESAEEARLRLRDELLALQGEEAPNGD